VHQLFIDFEKAYESVKREFPYNNLLDFVITKEPVRLIKMCLNETYSKIPVGKIYLINFLFRMVWNREMLYRHCFSTLLQDMPQGKSKKMKSVWN
jgi:hypothetical protein